MLRIIPAAALLVFLAGADGGVSGGDADQVLFVQAKAAAHGDPLPAGALARMGTLRWRHGDTINYVAYTPDGKAVLAASRDGAIRLWDRATGKELRRFDIKPPEQPNIGGPGVIVLGRGASGTTSRIALSPDGKILAAVLPNNVIQQWDVDTGKELRQIKMPPGGAIAILFAPDSKSLAVRAGAGTTHILETTSGNVLCQIKSNQNQPAHAFGGAAIGSGLAYSADSKFIATAEVETAMAKANTFAKITEIATGKEVRRIDTTPRNVTSLAYSPDGKLFACASGVTISLREADGGKEIHEIKTPGAIACLVFAPDGKTLAAKGRDQIIRVFETATAKSISEFSEPVVDRRPANGMVFFIAGGGVSAEPRDFAFTPDSKTIVASAGQTVRFWSIATGKEQAVNTGHRGAVTAVVFTPDGKTLISRGADNTIRRWNASTGDEVGSFPETKGAVNVAFAPDGTILALTKTDGTIRVLAAADGKELHSFKGHANGAASLAFAPNSKMLASCGNADGTIRLFDLDQGKEMRNITMPGATVAGNPGVVVFGGGNGGGIVRQGIAFSPDGQTIAVSINAGPALARRGGGPPGDSTLRLWDVGTGKEVRKITLATGRAVNQLAFSPNGRLLATDNADQTVSLWEIASGRERAVLGAPAADQTTPPAMEGAAISLAFSPDGNLLAARGANHSVRLWEVIHATELDPLKGHEGPVQTLVFAKSGKALATGSADTTILVWNLDRPQRHPSAPAALQPKEFDALWADLIGDDAIKAARSIQTLAVARATVPYLRARLKPAVPVDEKKLAQAVAELSSNNFTTRTKATQELERLGDLAVPALKKVLASTAPLETVRRVEPLLEKLTTGDLSAEQFRLVRALEVLERIGTPEACALLQILSKGAPGALTTRQAQGVLDYLAKTAK